MTESTCDRLTIVDAIYCGEEITVEELEKLIKEYRERGYTRLRVVHDTCYGTQFSLCGDRKETDVEYNARMEKLKKLNAKIEENRARQRERALKEIPEKIRKLQKQLEDLTRAT